MIGGRWPPDHCKSQLYGETNPRADLTWPNRKVILARYVLRAVLPALAAATRVWRDFFQTPTQVYREGYDLTCKGLDAS